MQESNIETSSSEKEHSLVSGDQSQPCKISTIDSWLAERNKLLVLYCKLSGHRNQQQLPDDGQISRFCDILVDYTSAGHFEVYQQIVSACEVHGEESIKLLEKLYPQISQTTDIVVNFNDKYSNFSAGFNRDFDDDLSLLGEAIARRVELEDNLIETLKSKH